MTPEERRASPESGKDQYEGRDLLVGRPERAEGRPTAAAGKLPLKLLSPQPAAHDEAIAEILKTVRATAARIEALQDEPGPGDETARQLARETAALTQAVADARGALTKAAELAARRHGAAETARALAGAAASLKTQGEALDQRIRAIDRQSAVATHCRLSSACGHRRPSMTLRYARVGDREIEAAAERIGTTAIVRALDSKAR